MTPHHITYDTIDPAQVSWVNRFYKQCRYDAKARPGETVVVARYNGQIIAALRLLPKSQPHICMRSLCVSPSLRGQGTATSLLQHVFDPDFNQICYCYALPHLSALYASVGFIAPDIATLPGFIRLPYTRYINRGQKLTIMIRYPEASTIQAGQPGQSGGSDLTHLATCGKTTPKSTLLPPVSCN